jgi:hypothetical protein
MKISELPKLEIASESYEEILHYNLYYSLRTQIVGRFRPISRELGKLIVDFDYS